jgi:poly(3-hydroxybutyrate) depolymerase
MYVLLAFSILLADTAQAAKSIGCGQVLSKDLSKGQTGHSNALAFNTADGTERSYLLHIPDGYDSNIPTGLIWSYHGRGKDSEHQEKVSKFSDHSSTPNYLVVYPQGTPKTTSKSKNARRRESDDEYDFDDEGDEWNAEEEDYGDDHGDDYDDEGDTETSGDGGKSNGSGKSGGKKGA